MTPATRTPEGDSGRCLVCGSDVTLEASVPPGDAPCPNCGCLVWFEIGKSKPAVPREAIAATRHHISAIVREIAALSGSDLAPSDFYERFLVRTVQAMAAVGGAVWLLERPGPWPLHWFQRRRLQLACQINVTDHLLSNDLADAKLHQQLLQHAITLDSEQLVPPLSGQRIGGNPTKQLLVLNPLRNRDRIVGVVEIFQRPNTAAATQRGYMQFLKQMCEIGSGYLERQQLA